MSPDIGILREFIGALKIAREEGFSPWSVLTHAWHESGAFRKVIGNHNYWGIKVPRKWQGKVEMVETHEYIKGKYAPVVATFIDFDSALEAMSWDCNFIRRLYPEAYYKRDNPTEYFIGLVSGKLRYATDPNYSTKLTSLYRVLEKDLNIAYLIDYG